MMLVGDKSFSGDAGEDFFDLKGGHGWAILLRTTRLLARGVEFKEAHRAIANLPGLSAHRVRRASLAWARLTMPPRAAAGRFVDNANFSVGQA